jgi:hypothetical protein
MPSSEQRNQSFTWGMRVDDLDRQRYAARLRHSLTIPPFCTAYCARKVGKRYARLRRPFLSGGWYRCASITGKMLLNAKVKTWCAYPTFYLQIARARKRLPAAVLIGRLQRLDLPPRLDVVEQRPAISCQCRIAISQPIFGDP